MSESQPNPETDEGEEQRERTTIRQGREYEETFRLDAAEAGEFLVEVGEQLQAGDELTLTTDEWELPFAFGEPVELEVEFEGVDDPELELELELPGRTDERAPSVE
jgi:amphi-Trp domain-containing protein